MIDNNDKLYIYHKLCVDKNIKNRKQIISCKPKKDSLQVVWLFFITSSNQSTSDQNTAYIRRESK